MATNKNRLANASKRLVFTGAIIGTVGFGVYEYGEHHTDRTEQSTTLSDGTRELTVTETHPASEAAVGNGMMRVAAIEIGAAVLLAAASRFEIDSTNHYER